LSRRSMNTRRLSRMTKRSFSRFSHPFLTAEFPYNYTEIAKGPKWKLVRLYVCFYKKQCIDLGFEFLILSKRCDYMEGMPFHHQEFPLGYDNLDGNWTPKLLNVWLYRNPIKIKINLDYSAAGLEYFFDYETIVPERAIGTVHTRWVTVNFK